MESIQARMAPQRKAVSPLEKFGGAKSKDVVTIKALNAGVAVKEATCLHPNHTSTHSFY